MPALQVGQNWAAIAEMKHANDVLFDNMFA